MDDTKKEKICALAAGVHVVLPHHFSSSRIGHKTTDGRANEQKEVEILLATIQVVNNLYRANGHGTISSSMIQIECWDHIL